MKLGVSLRIDVTKIDKGRIYHGKKGKYVNLVTFIDTESPGKYGDHGFLTHEKTKEEQSERVRLPIIGNVKIFRREDDGGYPAPAQTETHCIDDGEVPF